MAEPRSEHVEGSNVSAPTLVEDLTHAARDHSERPERRVELIPPGWIAPAVILTIIAVAVVVRVLRLDALGFNSDEAVYTGQAGALAGFGNLARSFSPFRAHPLLLQTVLATEFAVLGHVSELGARLTIAAMGVGTVYVTYRLGSRLYGVTVGLVAAAVLALMPYHVFISRQVLLDVPAGFALLLSFAALYRYRGFETRRWLYLCGALAGVACVIKETMVIAAPAVIVYLAWAGLLRKTRVRDGFVALVLMGVMLTPFVATRLIFQGSDAGGYIIYQLFREPNHPVWYFPVVLWIFATPLVVLAAIGGFVLCCIRRDRGAKLLLSWLIVFGLFFQLWPTKLLPYLIVLAPPIAIVGGLFVVEGLRAIQRRITSRVAGLAATVAIAALVLLPMVGPALGASSVIRDSSFSGPLTTDVEVQDFAGGRETGRWLGQYTPSNAVVLTMGPSLGNLVSFYGDRDWYALSVSQDPNLRNPAYRPISNPDAAIRQINIEYAIWDAYTADRSPFFAHRLNSYVGKYSGTPVFSVWVDGNSVETGRVAPEGAEVRIVVYQLVGGDPLVPPDEVAK
jgi:hypothetical protein